MGPPVFPRGGSQGPMDPSQMHMGMNMGGMNVGMGMGMPGGMNMGGMPQGLTRQPSSGGLSVNTNVVPSTSAPGALGSSSMQRSTASSSSGQNQMFMTPAQTLIASGGTPTSASSPANLGSSPASVEGQVAGRQGSIPPNESAKMAPPPIARVPTADGQVSPVNGTATTASSSSTPATAPTAPVPTGPPTIVPALPPLPANVTLNPKTTRITVVPLIDSTKLISSLSSEEVDRVKEWMKKDKEYEGGYRQMKERMGEEMRASVNAGRGWWEKQDETGRVAGRRGEKFGVTGFRTGKEDRRRKVGRREGFKL